MYLKYYDTILSCLGECADKLDLNSNQLTKKVYWEQNNIVFICTPARIERDTKSDFKVRFPSAVYNLFKLSRHFPF